jgi:hypothetical protein
MKRLGYVPADLEYPTSAQLAEITRHPALIKIAREELCADVDDRRAQVEAMKAQLEQEQQNPRQTDSVPSKSDSGASTESEDPRLRKDAMRNQRAVEYFILTELRRQLRAAIDLEREERIEAERGSSPARESCTARDVQRRLDGLRQRDIEDCAAAEEAYEQREAVHRSTVDAQVRRREERTLAHRREREAKTRRHAAALDRIIELQRRSIEDKQTFYESRESEAAVRREKDVVAMRERFRASREADVLKADHISRLREDKDKALRERAEQIHAKEEWAEDRIHTLQGEVMERSIQAGRVAEQRLERSKLKLQQNEDERRAKEDEIRQREIEADDRRREKFEAAALQRERAALEARLQRKRKQLEIRALRRKEEAARQEKEAAMAIKMARMWESSDAEERKKKALHDKQRRKDAERAGRQREFDAAFSEAVLRRDLESLKALAGNFALDFDSLVRQATPRR